MPYRTNASRGRGGTSGYRAGSFASAASSTATRQNAVGRGGGRGAGAGRGAGSRGRGRGSERGSTALGPVSQATAIARIFSGDAFSKFLNPQELRLVSVPHTFPNVEDWCMCIAHNLVLYIFWSKFQVFNYVPNSFVQTLHDECVFL